MKIVIPPKWSRLIHKQVQRHTPNETKGALFARRINEEMYEIDDIYFEKQVGSFAFVTLYNNQEYKNFQELYHQKHRNDYQYHNYIGDWHSHPSFECIPSSYDILEVQNDLENSNADFLIQVIVKSKQKKLIGSAFLYNRSTTAEPIDLEILN